MFNNEIVSYGYKFAPTLKKKKKNVFRKASLTNPFIFPSFLYSTGYNSTKKKCYNLYVSHNQILDVYYLESIRRDDIQCIQNISNLKCSYLYISNNTKCIR